MSYELCEGYVLQLWRGARFRMPSWCNCPLLQQLIHLNLNKWYPLLSLSQHRLNLSYDLRRMYEFCMYLTAMISGAPHASVHCFAWDMPVHWRVWTCVLDGRINITRTFEPFDQLAIKFSEASNYKLTQDGTWVPVSCNPLQMVAIIIPYRNREANLSVFLNNVHPILRRQKLGYEIIVMEQVCPLSESCCLHFLGNREGS